MKAKRTSAAQDISQLPSVRHEASPASLRLQAASIKRSFLTFTCTPEKSDGLLSHISCCERKRRHGPRMCPREHPRTGLDRLSCGIFYKKASGARGDRAELARRNRRSPGDPAEGRRPEPMWARCPATAAKWCSIRIASCRTSRSEKQFAPPRCGPPMGQFRWCSIPYDDRTPGTAG
jgi:hypothetical protein